MLVRSTRHDHSARRTVGTDPEAPPLRTGEPVQVLNRFEGRWIHGFSVASSGAEGYQLRRASDGAILPAWFPPTMVRSDGTSPLDAV